MPLAPKSLEDLCFAFYVRPVAFSCFRHATDGIVPASRANNHSSLFCYLARSLRDEYFCRGATGPKHDPWLSLVFEMVIGMREFLVRLGPVSM